MIKRTIEISRDAMHVSVKLDQLRLHKHTEDGSAPLAGSIPCEDIGLVMVDHPRTTYTHSALAKLAECGAAVVVCGRDHLPAGMLLPLADHTEVVWRIDAQIKASKPVVKSLWKQIVVAKIKAQAWNLDEADPARKRLNVLARGVRSGDPANAEAQAAKVYWGAWSKSAGVAPPLTPDQGGGERMPWRRDADGDDPVNVMLNYGYAVLRAAVGRAIVGAGLIPSIGIHHRNRSNAFSLADDLLEPVRPMVDAAVGGMVPPVCSPGADKTWALGREQKAVLLGLLGATVRQGGRTGPLMVALHRYAASFAACLNGERKNLLIPTAAGADDEQ